jgi:hypothetical protein
VVAEVQQLFDLNQEPAAKEQLLSGAVNFVRCPHCGYQGNLATPIVYHDPGKELLLTHVPAELGLPQPEQERLVGSMINKVMDKLPQEKRKAYLLSPQTTLTYQGLIERILEADGITKDVIEAQQKKLSLMQRLLDASDDVRDAILKDEQNLVDAEFFALLSRLIEGSLASGDEAGTQRLAALQDKLLETTSYGQEVGGQVREIEAAVQSLQDAGENLTRETLLDLMMEAPGEARLRALVSLARQGMDYTFFQNLTDRIEAAEGPQRDELTALREKLLELTREVDAQLESRLGEARQLLNAILQSHNIAEATAQNLGGIDNFFIQVLNAELERAERDKNADRLRKLGQVVEVLNAASQPNEEIAFIQELVQLPDAEARQQMLSERSELITEEFVQVVTALLNQAQSSGNQELADALRDLHRMAVRQAMQANLRGS